MDKNIIVVYLGNEVIVCEFVQNCVDNNGIVITTPLQLTQSDDGITFKIPIWKSVTNDRVFSINPNLVCSANDELVSAYKEVLNPSQQQNEDQNEEK